MAMPEKKGNGPGGQQVNLFRNRELQADAFRVILVEGIFGVELTHPDFGRTHGNR
jgi:hypothetical protein